MNPIHRIVLPALLLTVAACAASPEADDTDSADGALSPTEAQSQLTPAERTEAMEPIARLYSAVQARTFVEYRPTSGTAMDADAAAYRRLGYVGHVKTWKWPGLSVHVLELANPSNDRTQLRFYDAREWFIGTCFSTPKTDRLESCTTQ